MINAQDILIYRDAMMLVLNKPAGYAVHRGSGRAPNLDPIREQLCFGLPRIPEIAHRLDKDTSGCLILGRHAEALRRLGKLFQNNQIEKTYLAIVAGVPDAPEGTIDLPLGRQSSDKNHWWMKVDPENGQTAITHYQVLGHQDGYALLFLKPETGRTHQLRVHCAAMGFPIVGDKIYGPEKKPDHNLMLHAYQVKVPIYPKKDPILISAPLPPHWQDFSPLLTHATSEGLLQDSVNV